jgi:predicted TIM-barrel fold metal-dependent hydrolase
MTTTAVPAKREVFLRDLPIIDAHHHFWNLDGPLHYPWLQSPPWLKFRYGDYANIRSSFLPEDYRRVSGMHRIVGSIHMEAEPKAGSAVEEIAWLASLGDQAPLAAAAQIWLDKPDCTDQIKRLLEHPLVRSVRHKPTAQPKGPIDPSAPGGMDCPDWRRGYEALARTDLHFELQAPYWHLPQAAKLAADFPETTIILNHCGLPHDRTPSGLAKWSQAITIFAAEPNTVVKLSGIGLAPGTWPAFENRQIVRQLAQLFGSGRAMFASNFPVDSICVSYERMFTEYKTAGADLSDAEILELFGGTAARVYRLPRNLLDVFAV